MFAIVNGGVAPMFYSNPWLNYFYDFNQDIQKRIIDSYFNYHLNFQGRNWDILHKMVSRNHKKTAELNCLISDEYDFYSYQMSSDELREYNFSQIEEIKKYKSYLENSENREYDMDEVVGIWANKYSHQYRKYWHLKKLMSV